MLRSRFTLKSFGKLCIIPKVFVARASGRYKTQSKKAPLNLDLHCKKASKRETATFNVSLYREFAQLQALKRLPDESSILRFRCPLEEHQLAGQILATVNALLSQRGLLLKAGTLLDATMIAAPTSTKNKDKSRDREM